MRAIFPVVAAALLAGCASAPEPKPEPEPELEYRLGAEDVVEVSVYGAEALSRTLPVRPDGRISLPLLGDVEARGRTAAQLAQELAGRLAPFVQDPRVSVIVREVNSPRVYVIGEVEHPGAYPLRGRLDVIQALALAGGFGDFASRGSIVLIRGGEQGERTRVDYDALVDAKASIPLLRAGDTLYVP
jgi:polysaccharide export outer membrane protein